MALIAVVNGPNLNLLGSREPGVYGTTGWKEVRENMENEAEELGLELEFFQSNHEGDIVDYIQGLPGRARGLIVNPGALTHYSYSLRDAISFLDMPSVEVHISNIYAREEWRSRSVISPVVEGVVAGLGTSGYELALAALAGILEQRR